MLVMVERLEMLGTTQISSMKVRNMIHFRVNLSHFLSHLMPSCLLNKSAVIICALQFGAKCSGIESPLFIINYSLLN